MHEQLPQEEKGRGSAYYLLWLIRHVAQVMFISLN